MIKSILFGSKLCQRVITVYLLLIYVHTGYAMAQYIPEEISEKIWECIGIYSDGRMQSQFDKKSYTMTFNSDGTVYVLADCNQGKASAKFVEGGLVEIQRLTTTRAMCPPESLSNEFIDHMRNMRKWQNQGGKLFILGADNGILLEFEEKL
ncbi:META domain-containing protein [Methylobacterium sp. 190mf]|uniref:META domain-containing protein n=1 Tax=Methylobacterium sp. 190mf TaxID=1761798 RepID=UPI000CDEF326|nr:META domain-containing protein [Methylobacterium sp. 190mf]